MRLLDFILLTALLASATDQAPEALEDGVDGGVGILVSTTK